LWSTCFLLMATSKLNWDIKLQSKQQTQNHDLFANSCQIREQRGYLLKILSRTTLIHGHQLLLKGDLLNG
jgi:hypothetical protein